MNMKQILLFLFMILMVLSSQHSKASTKNIQEKIKRKAEEARIWKGLAVGVPTGLLTGYLGMKYAKGTENYNNTTNVVLASAFSFAIGFFSGGYFGYTSEIDNEDEYLRMVREEEMRDFFKQDRKNKLLKNKTGGENELF